MRRPDIDDDEAAEVDELDEAAETERILLEEAADEALVEAHTAETSLPWHVFDLFFRPRLFTLRWTQDADDRLRDRAVAVAALAAIGLVLAMFNLAPGETTWNVRFQIIGTGFVAFLIYCVVLAADAKVYDTLGRGLGAAGNYDRVRVVLAALAVPPLMVVIPVLIYRLIVGTDTPPSVERLFALNGFEWILSAAYALWSWYFAVVALKTVYHYRVGSAIANHLFGSIAAGVVSLVFGFVIFYLFRFDFGFLNAGP